MSSNCSKSTQIENRHSMEEFFNFILTIELQKTKQGHYGGNYNKGFKQGHYSGNYNKRNK